MTDSTGHARRRQLLAAVTMLTVSLGMDSTAIANQMKEEGVGPQKTKVHGGPGRQHSLKYQSQPQHSLNVQTGTQHSYKTSPNDSGR
jgi:hypothetical protein